jgi:hypothetical protein
MEWVAKKAITTSKKAIGKQGISEANEGIGKRFF